MADPDNINAELEGIVSFALGDRVILNNPSSKHHGKIGTITGYSEKYNQIGIRFDDDTRGQPGPDYVEHATDYTDEAHEGGFGFKKNDMARINNPRSKYHERVMTVTGYSAKYDAVRGKIDRVKPYVEFPPDQLEKVAD